MDQLKKKFTKVEENSNDPQLSTPETNNENSPNKFDELQKELEKKLNHLNQPKKEESKKEESKAVTFDSSANKINLNDYRAQMRQKFANPSSDNNIQMGSPPVKNESFFIISKLFFFF